ncbi:SDR family NAD(P)-dependent oxidoreductase, partial [Methylobacterium crusticola]
MQSAQRRVLITGGASGFGLAIAEALLAQGARVAI